MLRSSDGRSSAVNIRYGDDNGGVEQGFDVKSMRKALPATEFGYAQSSDEAVAGSASGGFGGLV